MLSHIFSKIYKDMGVKMKYCILFASLFLLISCSLNRINPEQKTINPGSHWTKGTKAFEEVTTEWNLEGVTGITFVVADIDNDNWPDVLIRNYGAPHNGKRGDWILRNTGDGTFEDFTEQSGLTDVFPPSEGEINHGAGSIFAAGDINNDGFIDLYVGNRRRLPEEIDLITSEIMLNNGDGTFRKGPQDNPVRFEDHSFTPTGASFLDYDRDGNLDLWVGNHSDSINFYPPAQDHLFKGDGTGNFTDVTEKTGLITYSWDDSLQYINEGLAHAWTWGVAAQDLNNDGIPELLASSYGRAPNHLWRGVLNELGEVVYINESVVSGYAYDDNMDWTIDMNGQAYCLKNPDAEGCDDCPELDESLHEMFENWSRWFDHELCIQPYSLGGNSGTTVCSDINNDGLIDLLTTEIVHSDVGDVSDHSEVLVNTGDPNVRFIRPGYKEMDLTRENVYKWWNHGDMTATVFDFDNDGWQDIFMGASDYAGNWGLLYHQTSPFEFERLETEDYFLHYRAMGQAVADFDRDGDLDIIVGHHRIRPDGQGSEEVQPTGQIRLYENLMGENSNWLQIKLVGENGSNKMAIGAKIEVTTGDITQTQYVDGGHGKYTLQRNAVLHFGLGKYNIAEVKVIWPDGERTIQEFKLSGNRRYGINQHGKLIVIQ
jgi:enediyne biosynthesis protein E4